MRNKGTFVRMFFALSLILALGVAPGLGVYAQQAAQKQPAPRAEVAAEKATKAPAERQQQLSPEGEPLPLSDAELEKVEGGIGFLAPAAWFAGSVAAGYVGNVIYNRFHKNSCTPTRRR